MALQQEVECLVAHKMAPAEVSKHCLRKYTGCRHFVVWKVCGGHRHFVRGTDLVHNLATGIKDL